MKQFVEFVTFNFLLRRLLFYEKKAQGLCLLVDN